MLHLRSLAPLATVWDRMIASDPGLLRLIMALRGTSAVFLTSVTELTLAHFLHTSPVDLAYGVVFSMMAPFLTREPTRRQRQRTMLLLPLPAAIACVATTLLHGHGYLGEAFFLTLVGVCCLAQTRGPQAIGMGLVAVVTSYVGLYLELPPATLPIQLLAIGVAVPVTWFACFILFPLRPAATLRRTVQAVQGRAALVLRDARAPDGAASLRHSLARLNEAALAADDQLTLLYPAGSTALRSHLMDLELAAARLAAARPGALAGAAGRRHAARLQAQERRLHRGRFARHHLRGSTQSIVAVALADISRAAAALGEAASVPPATPPMPAAPPPGPLAWRMALRVTLASALAMGGGMALSPQRWFWAVITTYVVFLGTRSRGDAIYRGVQRLGGTLMGLVAGVTLAVLLQGAMIAEAIALLAAVFGMYYLILISYTLGIFCVTLLLGLIYSLLGASIEPLLLLRLEETAIGAAAAILVATLVVPIRTRDQVGRSGTAVLRALAAAVGTCRRVLAGETDARPLPAMRLVDRQMADLRLALLPFTAGRFVLRRTALERPVPALLECVHWARELSVAVTAADPAAASRAATIERLLGALAAGSRTANDPVPPAPPHPADPVEGALDQLDRATSVLAERLAIGALQGFRLEG